jgi:predicted nucleic acid-binding protein
MLVYLDNCCYNRPFDDQTHVRIKIETLAKMHVQALVVNKEIDLAVSFISRSENNDNPFVEKKNSISRFFKFATVYIGTENIEEIKLLRDNFMRMNIKMKDATHLACAIMGKCDYLITTDDNFIKRYKENQIQIVNPIDFLERIKGGIK